MTGSTLPALSWVLALNCLQKSMMFTPFEPRAGPTGGEGLAITFISLEEQAQFKRIENFLEKEVYKIPIDPKFGEAPLYEPEKYGNMRRGRGRPSKPSNGGGRKPSNRQGSNSGKGQQHRGRPRKEA